MIRKKLKGKLPYFNMLVGIWILGFQLKKLIMTIRLQEEFLNVIKKE